MYMRTPKIFGRPMKKVKEYEHFVMYVDEKTGIRECFQYWDLTHEIIEGKSFKYNDKGELEPVEDQKPSEYVPVKPKKHIKNDNRLSKLIEYELFSDLI